METEKEEIVENNRQSGLSSQACPRIGKGRLFSTICQGAEESLFAAGIFGDFLSKL